MFAVCWAVLVARFVTHNSAPLSLGVPVFASIFVYAAVPALVIVLLVPGKRASLAVCAVTAAIYAWRSWWAASVTVSVGSIGAAAMAGDVLLAGITAFASAVLMLGAVQLARKSIGLALDDSPGEGEWGPRF